jgi:pimeloyl-ACP methyl ester carboxylesterase
MSVEHGVLAGLHFQVYRGGTGAAAPPVVLLPGLLSDGRQLRRVARGLPRDVVVVDPLGVGGSDAPQAAADYALPELAARLLALLDGIGLHRADLVGLSMGGMWAQHALVRARASARTRDRFRAAVLVASAADVSPRLRSVLAGLLAFHRADVAWRDIFRTLQLLLFAPEFLDRPSVVPMLDLLAGEVQRPPHVIEGQAAALLGHDLHDQLPGLPVRRVLAGDQDLLMPPHTQRRLGAALGGLEPAFLLGGGHALWIERPVELSTALADALSA